jgi:O-antigen/teichoic acid export membrane protein
MASPLKSLIGQTAVYGISSIVGRFINFLLVPFYSYIFHKYEYGVVAELTAYVTILVVLFTYGLETAFFRYSQNEKYSKQSVYSTALGSLAFTSFIFIVIFILLGKKIASLIDYKQNIEFVYLLGITVAIDAFSSLPFAYLRNVNKAARFAKIKIANISINIFFNVFFLFLLPYFFGNNNFIYQLLYPNVHVGYIFISYLLASVCTLFLLLPEIKIAFTKNSFDFKLLKTMLIFSFPVLLTGLAGMFNESFDRILLKYLIVVPQNVIESFGINISGNDLLELKKKFVMGEIGIYGANVKIAVIMTLFFQAFRYAAEPFFFSYAKNADSRIIYARVMKYFVVFSLFIFLSVTLFIDVVQYLLGKEYRVGLKVVPMLLLSKIFIGIIFNLSIWYKLKNLTKYGTYIAVVGTFSMVLSNFILIPMFSYIGAAWASVISYFIMLVVSFILEKRNFAIPYDYLSIALYFGCALSFYFINYYARIFTEYYLILNILMIFAFIYIFIKKEKIDFLNILKSIKTLKR